MAEYTLPDGRTLVVGPFETRPEGLHWSCWVPGESEFPVNGFPLNKTIAAALGYDPSTGDGWPSWIDELAAEIEALPRPQEIRLADPTKHEDGFGAASHDYHVVFWTEVPSGLIFAALEYDVGGAQDVQEVIEWAEREAGPDDCYTLFVRFDSPLWARHGAYRRSGSSVRPEHMTFRRRHPLRRNSELSPDSHE
jgi:hypothetical protein